MIEGITFKPSESELKLIHPEFKQYYEQIQEIPALTNNQQTTPSVETKEYGNLFGSYSPAEYVQIMAKNLKDGRIQKSSGQRIDYSPEGTATEKVQAERLRAKLKSRGLSDSDTNYLTHMAYKESRYGLNTESEASKKANAHGIWQITKPTQETYGYSRDKDLNEDEQIDVMIKYLADSRRLGKRALKRAEELGYSPYAVLATQHLGGVRGGSNYWVKGEDASDGMTYRSDYAKEFDKYNY